MATSLRGMVCLVTGGTRGIGRGIALQLGQAGATVYVTGRTLKKNTNTVGGSLEEIAADIEGRGGVCIPVQCDHAKDEDVQRLFDQINKEQNGRLDILVNNAYAAVNAIFNNMGTPFWEADLGMWDLVNNVGLRNHYLCTIHACRMMVPRKQGLIVNVSSPGGLRYLFNIPYGVGKCALDRMAADVAVETRKHKITCVSLWPGAVKTEVVTDLIVNQKGSDKALPGVNAPKGAQMEKMFMDDGETTELPGLAIVHLAQDPNKLKKTGKILLTADLADEYKFKDIDGSTPSNLRSLSTILLFEGWHGLSRWIPAWVKIPGPLVWMASNKL